MKNMLHICAGAGLIALLGLSTSYAQDTKTPESSTAQSLAKADMPQIHPKDFYAFATIADKKLSAAFGKITNHTDKPVALVKVEILGKNKGTAELHETSEKDGAKVMQQVERIEIPADSTIELAPGGLHIMLIDLKSHLKAGQTISLKLYFNDDSTAVLEVPVKARTSAHHPEAHHPETHTH